jgi:nitrate reductase delta subunit
MDVAARRLLHLFSVLLEYPGPSLAEVARACEDSLAARYPSAAKALATFRLFAEQTPVSRLEEIYTSTFDLDPRCHPYVGYHLFGESYKRSVFLLGLKERYQQRGLDAGAELPDHLAVILRFLADYADLDQVSEIFDEAIRPALERMLGQLDRSEGSAAETADANSADDRTDLPGASPYQSVLVALSLMIGSERGSSTGAQPAAMGSPSGGA